MLPVETVGVELGLVARVQAVLAGHQRDAPNPSCYSTGLLHCAEVLRPAEATGGAEPQPGLQSPVQGGDPQARQPPGAVATAAAGQVLNA